MITNQIIVDVARVGVSVRTERAPQTEEQAMAGLGLASAAVESIIEVAAAFAITEADEPQGPTVHAAHCFLAGFEFGLRAGRLEQRLPQVAAMSRRTSTRKRRR